MRQKNQLKDLRRQEMPKGEILARQAQKQLRLRYQRKGKDPFHADYLKANCDQIFDELLSLEFELYKQKERDVNTKLLWLVLQDAVPATKRYSRKEIEAIIKGKFDDLRDFYKSIMQSRSSRAGGSVQNHIAYILTTLGYPFEAQQTLNGKPDFILPCKKLYQTNPAECVLVTAKRTLRERWRQIITEGFKSPQYFLVTIDEKQSKNGLQEMAGHRIYLVVPERLKTKIPSYKAAGNVISIKAFLKGYLDPAMSRWHQAKIIP